MTRTRAPRPPARQPARTAEPPDRASSGTVRPPPSRVRVFHGGRPPAPPAPPSFAFRSLRIQGERAGTVQLRARDPRRLPADAIHQVAAAGVHTSGQPLPHRDRLQRAFGPAHDLSGITAHIGGAAAEASARLGADGYALGDHVAFRSAPDLRLAAHETAHVLQQRGGIRLPDGVGHAGDRHERQADAVAERVVRGQSVADLLPAPATLRAAVQLDQADVDEAERYLQDELTAYEARAASLAPGPEKAAALRVILLLQAQAFTAFASADQVAALLARLEAKARDERATLTEVVDKLGVDADAVLLDSARAFPGIWADRLAKMFARIDENDLARVMATTQQGALGLAASLRDDIWDQGLPLTLAEANQLTWGLVFASVLNLELARSDSQEPTARFARAALLWERATRHYILVHAYNNQLRRKVDAVRAGQQVMDQGEWNAAVGAERLLDNQLDLLRRRDLSAASTIFLLQLFEPTTFYRVTATPSLRHQWPEPVVDALATELARVDQKITAASSGTLIWRAGAWAYHRGYFGDVARAAWDGFVDDIPGTVAKMMAILGLQAIPGVNVLVDIVLICEFGIDILETAIDLFKMFQKAGSAKSLLDLEHASARMAQTLVGTAAKLVLWAVTWGVAKGAGKIRNWRDAERFVRDNSRTPAARDEARRLLSEASGNAEKARKLLENKRALERQQREAAAAEQARRQAEADAAAKRKAEAEAANKRRSDEEARRPAEAETKRKADEAEAARRQAEAEAQRKAAEAEAARRQAEAEAQRKAAETTRKQAEERAAEQARRDELARSRREARDQEKALKAAERAKVDENLARLDARGLPQVRGRPVKPRIATSTQYFWENPLLGRGNAIEADFNNGVLTHVGVKSKGPDADRVGGARLLGDVFAYFGEQNIKQFNGEWVKAAEWDRNYSEFVENFFIKKMPADKAAWETWTGRELKARGFKTVEISPAPERGGTIHGRWTPIFRK
jgi:hypothetical protein